MPSDNLRDLLASLYLDYGDIKRIAGKIGIPPEKLTPNKTINVWVYLLLECQRSSLLDNLLKTVSKDNPNQSSELTRLCQLWIDRPAFLNGKVTPPISDTFTEPTPRALRFWSTPESIVKGEITVLAIIETLLAMALLITLTVWFDTMKWLAGACAIAPFTLLRTNTSIKRGVIFATTEGITGHLLFRLISGALILAYMAWYIYISKEKLSTTPGLLSFLFQGLLLALMTWLDYALIRLGATAITFLEHPLQMFAAILDNWRRVMFSEDSKSIPVLLPGLRVGPFDIITTNWPKQWHGWNRCYLNIMPIWILFVVSFSVPPLYLLTAAYRWSVKAIFPIYLPIVWMAKKAQYYPRNSVRTMLHDYLVDDIQRVRRWLAWFSVTALTAKVFVWWHLDDARTWIHENFSAWGLKLLHGWRHYIDPQHVPWWQITPALNGVLAICLMIYARRVLNLKDYETPDTVVLRNWRIVNVLSAALSIYTIACVLLITWKAGDLLGTLHKLWEMVDHTFLP